MLLQRSPEMINETTASQLRVAGPAYFSTHETSADGRVAARDTLLSPLCATTGGKAQGLVPANKGCWK